MTAADHVAALLEHGGAGLIDMCLCNNASVSAGLLERYSAEDAEPMQVSRRDIELLGVEVVSRPLTDESSHFARHSGIKVAEAVLELHRQRASTKIF